MKIRLLERCVTNLESCQNILAILATLPKPPEGSQFWSQFIFVSQDTFNRIRDEIKEKQTKHWFALNETIYVEGTYPPSRGRDFVILTQK